MDKNKDMDFEKKHEEDLQRLRGFRLLDDDFMSKVFEDTECAEFLLQIILKRKNHLPEDNGRPDLNTLKMLTLKNRLDEWKKEVRVLGYHPLIYVNYWND